MIMIHIPVIKIENVNSNCFTCMAGNCVVKGSHCIIKIHDWPDCNDSVWLDWFESGKHKEKQLSLFTIIFIGKCRKPTVQLFFTPNKMFGCPVPPVWWSVWDYLPVWCKYSSFAMPQFLKLYWSDESCSCNAEWPRQCALSCYQSQMTLNCWTDFVLCSRCMVWIKAAIWHWRICISKWGWIIYSRNILLSSGAYIRSIV